MARYVHLLDCLKEQNITPMVVLHHFSNPPWISAGGGWLNPATIPAFVDYATKLASALKERVYLWNTFNEPDTLRIVDLFNRWFSAVSQMAFSLLPESDQTHGRGARPGEPRHPRQGNGNRTAEVGIAKNWTYFEAFQKYSPWDHALATACHHTFNRFVLDAFLGGRRREASTYLGVNYYGRARLNHFQALVPTNGVSNERLRQLGVVCDDMFERHPSGFGKILKNFNSDTACRFTSPNTGRLRPTIRSASVT